MRTKRKKDAAVEAAAHGNAGRDGPAPRDRKGAGALGRTRIEAAAHQLRPAPWNPRPEVTSESVADIAASIRKIGLIQPLVVMRDPDKEPYGGVEFYVVVAGNRRLRACVDAGLSPIPCDVIDCDAETAKRITVIENLQRKDADPLMEADLVEGLIRGGMTRAEIAAETGRGEKWVARRANLVRLSKSWRERVARGERITVDCLEHVAAYPEEIQEKCKEGAGRYYTPEDDALTWKEVKWVFQRESRDLRDAVFGTGKCGHCPNNTGCCPELFDDDGGGRDAKLGRCLDGKCFAALTGAAVDEEAAKAEKKGRAVVRGKPYLLGVYGTTRKPTRANTTLYVYEDGGVRTFEYGEPPPEREREKAKSKEERKAEREAAKFAKLVRAAQDEAAERFERWIDEHEAGGVWPKWFVDCAVADLCEDIRIVGSDCESAVDAFARNTGFEAGDPEADAAYREYLAREGAGAE